MNRKELAILGALDLALDSQSVRTKIDEIVVRVERELVRKPDKMLAWKPIPLGFYEFPLPAGIRSSWIFILRGNTASGAERHPNSHQRMMSYRGTGDFQTRTEGSWKSHILKSERSEALERRWISIPPNVWHQGVVSSNDWVVVSFHTANESDLIEERPESGTSGAIRERKYL